MPLEVQIIRACEFVRQRAHGEFDLASTRAAIMALAAACRKRGVETAMVDIREATSNLSPKDLATLVGAFAKAAGPKRLRLAVLHRVNQNYRTKLFVFLSAMCGRKVKAFENFEQALVWISTRDDADAQIKKAEPENSVPVTKRSTARTTARIRVM